MKTTEVKVSNLLKSFEFYKSVLGFENSNFGHSAPQSCAILNDFDANIQIKLELSKTNVRRQRLPFCLPLTTQRAQIVLSNPSQYLTSLTAFAPSVCCKLPVAVSDPDGHLIALCSERVTAPITVRATSGFWQRFVSSFSQLADFHGYYRL